MIRPMAAMNPDAVRMVGDPGNPPVLLLHPWWGITPAVTGWASDLASAGRYVWIPDLYGGKTASTIEEAETLAQALLGSDGVVPLIDQCAHELGALGQPWAAMGFSLGGFLACPLAGRGAAGPDELVLFYGGQPPGGEVSRTRRVVLHVVPDDEFFTAEELATVEDGFRAAGTELTTYRYDGSHHWFAERGSPAFDEAAFELARTRVLEQLGR
jgi:carboxymethylenebutenolidase